MKVNVDLNSPPAKFRRVDILRHPPIPGPMAGINPRTIKGEEWWNTERRRAYESNLYHCFACGGRPEDDTYAHKLEAHEMYEVDFAHRSMKFTEIVALCYSCHSFIHSGRLASSYFAGHTPRVKLDYILERGVSLLGEAGLKPYWRTYALYAEICLGMMESEARRVAYKECGATMSEMANMPKRGWRLVFEGEVYYADK